MEARDDDSNIKTPDLRGQFILGASDDYELNSVGGVKAVALDIKEMPRHSHKNYRGIWHKAGRGNHGVSRCDSRYTKDGPPDTNEGGDPDDEGNTKPHNNMPPYHTLVYIIKCKEE